MIKKPLLKIIHFTLLFIIGLLFTIFLYKIKNTIFIEKLEFFTQARNLNWPPGVKVEDNTVYLAKKCDKMISQTCDQYCKKWGPNSKWVCFGRRCQTVRIPVRCIGGWGSRNCKRKYEKNRWLKKNGDAECGWDYWYDLCDKNKNKPCKKNTYDGKCYQKIQTSKHPGRVEARKWGWDSNASIYINPPTNIECEKTIPCDCPVDCKGITLPCSINCETGSNRFIVTQEADAGGSPCGYPSDCQDGDGACDSDRLKRVGSGGSWPDKISTIDEMNRARQLIIPPWVGEVMTLDEHKDKSTIDEDKKSKLKTIYRYDLMDSGESCVEDVDGGSLVGSYIYKIEENKRDLYRKCDGLYDSSGSFVREYV